VCEHTVERVPAARKHQPVETARRHRDETEKAAAAAAKTAVSLQARVQPLERETSSLRARIEQSEELLREYTERLRPFGKADLAALKEEYESARREADAAAAQASELTARSAAAAADLKDQQHRIALLQKDADANSEELAKLQHDAEKLRDELGSLADIEKLRSELEGQKQALAERDALAARREKLTEEISKAKDGLADAMAGLQALEATMKRAQDAIQTQRSRLDEQSTALASGFSDLPKPSAERDEASWLEERSGKLQEKSEQIRREIARLEERIRTLEGKIERAGRMRARVSDHQARQAVAATLAQTLHGDQFIAYIQEEAYARLAFDGSVHLKALSGGRYSFKADRDEFQVVDQWNADEPRPVATLSGGESFLASLALALALAEGLSGLNSGRGKFALESLFLDEGFGTLDPETLESVVAGIEGLSVNDRLIGIISHIPELAERMPARIEVNKAVGGSSLRVT
jgi:exonuclease SbcC